jgi:hypothetical protein
VAVVKDPGINTANIILIVSINPARRLSARLDKDMIDW